MRAGGYSLREIGEHFNLTPSAVAKCIAKALKDVQSPAVEQLRAQQQTMIDLAKTVILGVIERDHVAHSNGKVVEVWDGEKNELVPVLDDGPKLSAIGQLRGLLEREAKLHGADSPIRTVVEGDELVIRIKGVDTDAV